MLFLWTTTKHGKIWVDGDAVRQIIAKRLPKDFYCQEVSFIGEKNLLNIYITLPEDSASEEKAALEKKMVDIFGKSGMAVQIDWGYVAPEDNPVTTPLWMLPLFWSGVASGLTALVYLGLKGILWSLFAAVVGYGISWIFLTEDGQKHVSALMQQFRR
ncbi:MAG: hypothetical protein LLF78_01610 [Synergistaceae bacterium]|nr:hypothetical protein [Synergistaceae bacterium]